MGLKQFFQRWTKGEDARAVERAEQESQMTPHERDVDQEDFEGKKDDLAAASSFRGEAAEDVAAEDLDE
jgi:hypothetical protein